MNQTNLTVNLAPAKPLFEESQQERTLFLDSRKGITLARRDGKFGDAGGKEHGNNRKSKRGYPTV